MPESILLSNRSFVINRYLLCLINGKQYVISEKEDMIRAKRNVINEKGYMIHGKGYVHRKKPHLRMKGSFGSFVRTRV